MGLLDKHEAGLTKPAKIAAPQPEAEPEPVPAAVPWTRVPQREGRRARLR